MEGFSLTLVHPSAFRTRTSRSFRHFCCSLSLALCGCVGSTKGDLLHSIFSRVGCKGGKWPLILNQSAVTKPFKCLPYLSVLRVANLLSCDKNRFPSVSSRPIATTTTTTRMSLVSRSPMSMDAGGRGTHLASISRRTQMQCLCVEDIRAKMPLETLVCPYATRLVSHTLTYPLTHPRRLQHDEWLWRWWFILRGHKRINFTFWLQMAQFKRRVRDQGHIFCLWSRR